MGCKWFTIYILANKSKADCGGCYIFGVNFTFLSLWEHLTTSVAQLLGVNVMLLAYRFCFGAGVGVWDIYTREDPFIMNTLLIIVHI